MKFLLLIYGDEAKMQALNPERTAAYVAYAQALRQAGVLQGGNRLQPVATARTVRRRNGKASITDGPFAETKEVLGGYVLIEVPDLDAALVWAERCPGAAHGSIEVRPIWDAAASP
jgi:hypothetical protein